jgi:membrane protein
VWPVFARAFRLFSGKGARFLGAAVAFYALLSAAPLFVLVLHVVGAIFGRARAEGALWSGVGQWLAPEGLATAREVTERLDAAAGSGHLVASLLVLYGSTRLFRALRRALNQLWGIDLEAVERTRSKARKYGLRYGGAFALALFSSLLVGLLVVEKAGLGLLGSARIPDAVVWSIDIGTSVGLAFVLFTVLFRFLPERPVTLREAVLSALVSTALFALGSSLVTMVVRHKDVRMTELYAGASAVVLAVVWVYYSAQVFFFGACIGASLVSASRESDAGRMSIDVHVTGGGTISNGELRADTTAVARCTLCAKDVEAAVALGANGSACAACLRDRLDALSVARFRLRESRSGSLPWGKVTG